MTTTEQEEVLGNRVETEKQTVTLTRKKKLPSGAYEQVSVDYEIVASRVARFRHDYDPAKFALTSEIISITDTTVVIKAEVGVWENGIFQVLATGHASENVTSSGVNSTSALENCETGAIGRALASFGYIGSEFASADEIASAIAAEGKQQSAPAPQQERKEYVPSGKPLQGEITEAQLSLIYKEQSKLVEKDKMRYEDAKAWYTAKFGEKKPKQLSKQEASEFIDYLKNGAQAPVEPMPDTSDYSDEPF